MLTGESSSAPNQCRSRYPVREKCKRIGSWFLPYLAVIALSCLLLTGVLKLWKADLRVPFESSCDSIWVNTWIKTTQDHGWFLENPNLGAPGGSQLYDFPMSEVLHFGLIRLLGLVFYPSGFLFNVYVLLMYPLIACTALFVLRRLSVSTGLAIVGSLLYAFMPYHLVREHRHIFLASYYLVPLQIWICLVVAGSIQNSRPDGNGNASRISKKCIFGMLVVSLLASASGVYFAFFGCFFILLAGLHAAVRWGGWRNLGIACLLCGWTSVMTVVELAPSFLYHRTHGFNVEAVRRSHFESELYGLKVVQMLLPITSHRIKFLANLKERYRLGGLLINENDAASLGLIASIGFLLLLAQFLRSGRRSDSERPTVVQSLALLNLGALALATVGGFGSLFGLLGTPWIRGYNRISIFIAFFSIAALFMLLDPWLRRLAAKPRAAWLCVPLLALLLAVGVYDQTTPAMRPNYAELNMVHARRQEFVDRLEATLPNGAMIFQLPYFGYPEAIGYNWCESYDHLRPYLLSTSLRWSFGAVRGREGDSLYWMLATLPPKEMLEKLALIGYDGLFIDRLAYPDLAEKLEVTLVGLLGMPPLRGDDRRWMFFPLAEYRRKLRNTYSSDEWERDCADMSHPVVPLFGKGFQPVADSGPDLLLRGAQQNAEFELRNPAPTAREVDVDLEADRPQARGLLRVQYPGGSKEVVLDKGKPQHCHFTLTVPPGATKFVLTCRGENFVDSRDGPVQQIHGGFSWRLLGCHVFPAHAGHAPMVTSLGEQSKD